jgi:hypothetical protein
LVQRTQAASLSSERDFEAARQEEEEGEEEADEGGLMVA